MSDAKAKFEARKAKILARENARLAVASGEKSSLSEDISASTSAEGEATPEKIVRERPLAARRSLIRSVSSEMNTDATSGLTRSTSSQDNLNTATGEHSSSASVSASITSLETKPVDDSDNNNATNATSSGEDAKSAIVNPDAIDIDAVLDSVLASKAEDTKDASTTSTPTPSTPQLTLIPKSVREIEEEVARNTALFDESMRNTGPSLSSRRNRVKGNAGQSSSSGKDSGKEETSDSISKETQQVSAEIDKKKVAYVVPLQSGNVLRLWRMYLIILLAIAAGYYIASTPVDLPQTFSTMSIEETEDDPLNKLLSGTSSSSSGSFSSSSGYDINAGQSRTWGQWLQQKLAAQLLCSFSAVMAARWASQAMFGSYLNAKYPVKAQAGGNILTTIMSFFNNGIDALMEYVWSASGEVALHFTTMVCTVLVISILNGSGTTGASSMPGTIDTLAEL